jgi:hypothetical protein
VRCRLLIGPFKFKFDYLNMNLNINLTIFNHLRSKKSKKIKTSHLFYVSYLKSVYNCFLNFVVKMSLKCLNMEWWC